MDVDEGGDGLNLGGLLGVIKEVALARLVLGVPFEDVELCGHVMVSGEPRVEVWGRYLGIVCLRSPGLIRRDFG